MGVSGAGKTVVGRSLAEKLNWQFVEGDDYHPKSNVEKMRRGVPLSDADRRPWLARLRAAIVRFFEAQEGAVVACSALKKDYREVLSVGSDRVEFVLLNGSYELILERLRRREGHFMPPTLLQNQFDTLEIPTDALVLDAARVIPELIREICDAFDLKMNSERVFDQPTVLLDGLAFPEAPRWRDHRLWFTDQHAHRVCWVDAAGNSDSLIEMSDRPGGLGWLPDGTPLVVAMTERRVYKIIQGKLVLHADLTSLASFHCNDMIVDQTGLAYVGNFGYDIDSGEPVHAAELILIEPDGTPRVVAEDLIFPNGCVIDPITKEFVVAETFAHRLTRFNVNQDGALDELALWADLGDATPDGICLDEAGYIWVASPATGDVRRVARGGGVESRIKTKGSPFACMLGGDDRRTLYMLTAETTEPDVAAQRRSGRIEIVDVDTPGYGLP